MSKKTLFLLLATVLILSPGMSTAVSPNSQPLAMVSIHFDDGLQSTYNLAAPIMAEYGFTGTAYIYTQPQNEEYDGYMTWTQVQSLQNNFGWEIGSHAYSHDDLTQMSLNKAKQEIQRSKNDLESHSINVQSFASPYGAYNDEIVKLVARNFNSHRTAWNLPNTWPINDYYLKAKPVLPNTSVSEVQTWIDQAKVNNEWLILYFHHLIQSPDDSVDPPADNSLGLWAVDENKGQLIFIPDYTQPDDFINYGQIKWNYKNRLKTVGSEMEALTIDDQGIAYLVKNARLSSAANAPVLMKLDLNTLTPGDNPVVEIIGQITNAKKITGLSFDPNGKLYGLDNANGDDGTDNLLLINPANAQSTIMGSITGLGQKSDQGEDLTFAESGDLYLADDDDDHLYQIDPINGQIIALVDNNLANGTGYNSNKTEALVWDTQNNRLVGCNSKSGLNLIYRITTGNGNNSPYGKLSNALDIEGMAFGPGQTNPSPLSIPEGYEKDSYPADDFRAILDYIQASGMPVVTTSQGLQAWATGPNLVQNGSFTSGAGSDADFWIRSDNKYVKVGNYNQGVYPESKRNGRLTGGNTQRSISSFGVNVDPNLNYRLKAFYQISAYQSGDASVWISEFDQNYNYLDGQWLGGFSANFIGSRYFDYTPNPGTTFIEIYFLTHAGANMRFEVDGIELRQQ